MREPDTVIVDGMGYFHDGYTCECPACPYCVGDIDGNCACYADEFQNCFMKTEEVDNEQSN